SDSDRRSAALQGGKQAPVPPRNGWHALARRSGFCTPHPQNERTPKADGGRWGPNGDHQTAQGHQAILELSADGSIVPGDSTGVKHGSAYRRRAGDGVSKTGTDKPSLQSQAGASEHRTRNGMFRPPGRRSGVSDRGVWVQNEHDVSNAG
ncbi:MAG: hypothetical protein ACYTE0_07930, partial [Planctomycetota bacterium]